MTYIKDNPLCLQSTKLFFFSTYALQHERTKLLQPFFSRHYFHQSEVLMFILVLSEGRADEA